MGAPHRDEAGGGMAVPGQRFGSDVVVAVGALVRPVWQAGSSLAGRAADAVVPKVVEALMSRIDLTEIAQKNLDLDQLAASLDYDAIVDRLDLIRRANFVIDGVDLPQIIRDSSMGITSEAVRGVRLQTIEADQAVARFVDHLRPWRRNTEIGAAPGPSDDD